MLSKETLELLKNPPKDKCKYYPHFYDCTREHNCAGCKIIEKDYKEYKDIGFAGEE